MDKKGFIYVMTNPSMPGIVKVGMTKRTPDLRTLDNDLNSTGIPTPFQVEYYAFFDDMINAEKIAHKKLAEFHHGKEFFKTDVATAINAIESIDINFTKLHSKPEDDAKAAQIKIKKDAALKEKDEEEVIENCIVGSFFTQKQIIICSKCNRKYSLTFKRHESIGVCPFCHYSTGVKLDWQSERKAIKESESEAKAYVTCPQCGNTAIPDAFNVWVKCQSCGWAENIKEKNESNESASEKAQRLYDSALNEKLPNLAYLNMERAAQLGHKKAKEWLYKKSLDMKLP